MVIYIYNPQAGMYGKHVWSSIIGKKDHDKLSYILELSRKEPHKIKFVSDGLVSSFPLQTFIKTKWVRKLIGYVDYLLWCILNKVPLSAIRFGINDDNPIIFTMSNKSSVLVDESYKSSLILNCKCPKVIHMSHYFELTSNVSDSSRVCSINYAAAEANLKSNSPYFNKYFPHIENFVLLPFSLRNRYKSKTEYKNRKAKCLAIGTTHSMGRSRQNKDYQDFFKCDNWHPMRRTIYLNRSTITETIDCKISDYHADEGVKERTSLLGRIGNLLFGGRQSKYMSFDIVDLYNEYMMVVSPEENVGLASINFIESMSCGCLYLGSYKEVYDSLGLVPGVHYVLYEKNNLEDLQCKIKYYQENQHEAEAIAKKGMDFVTNNFSSSKVKELFLNEMERIVSRNS